MDIEVLPQIELGSVSRLRIGDFLNRVISNDIYHQFRFAVAYMRMSGLDRLGASIETLLNRGGQVAGAVGIDDGVTSVEALESLAEISTKSTIFYTVSGFIYHPKLYLINGDDQAVAIVGSPNLTRDGLFRNVELATAIYLDFKSDADYAVYKTYDDFMEELLNVANPNVQLISTNITETLVDTKVIKSEAQTEEPGKPLSPRKKGDISASSIVDLFPSIYVPAAPPTLKGVRTRPNSIHQAISSTSQPISVKTTSTFMMQLSVFDSSHRSGKKGTPEILVPNAAVDFFPSTISSAHRKYPDVTFDAILNTGGGRESHRYRFWHYPQRSENRLRLDHATIDLTDPNGGDLIVINKLSTPVDGDIFYEVTILSQKDPNFNNFLNQCIFIAKAKNEGKKWGMIK